MGAISSNDEAIVSTEAAADAAVEAPDYEVELFTGSNESIAQGGPTKSVFDWTFGERYRNGIMPNITIVSTEGSFPKTITLDYGDGLELKNGTILKGKIIILLSAPPRTDGAVRTVSFENFYVDSTNIAGTRTLTCSIVEGQNPKVNVVGNITLTFADGTTLVRETEKTREFIAGFDTPLYHFDDEISITGFTSSVCSEGYSHTATIQLPLIIKGECRFIVQGTVAIDKNDEPLALLNYGDGTCDNLATITVDGVTKEIKLGKRFRFKLR
jgi:hypothetical protein